MLPARFDYQRPETLEEALFLLDRYGEDGKILAGGQSLIPLMKLRFASPGWETSRSPAASSSSARWPATTRSRTPM